MYLQRVGDGVFRDGMVWGMRFLGGFGWTDGGGERGFGWIGVGWGGRRRSEEGASWMERLDRL